MVVTLILTVLFSLLLIYFPMPLEHARDNQINADVTIKQDQYDRWGVIPGQLGYKYTRNVKYSTLIQNEGAGEEKQLNMEINREFTNVDYAHTESVINYNQDY